MHVKPNKAGLSPQDTPKKETINFSTVLAASIHDMKNSLFLLLDSIEQVSQEITRTEPKQKLADIHYETQRLNTNLVQLLCLYRQDQEHLPIRFEECFLDELSEELEDHSSFYANHYNIQLEIQVLTEGAWFFDTHLIPLLLNDMLLNAMRYAKSSVLVQIEIEQQTQELLIQIFDDGPGYPAIMLAEHQNFDPQTYSLHSGRTGLGLYFSHLIAQAHRKAGRKGYVRFNNGGLLGGGQFTLRLP